VALVTGGASGIGAALCRELAARGAFVVVTDRDEAGAQAIQAEIQAHRGRTQACQLDVCNREAVEATIASTIEQHGRLDFVFNNAGVGCWGDARTFTAEQWREIFEINFWGAVHCALAAYRAMAERGGGKIINTASLAGLVPVPGAAPYTAAKHALVGFSLALRAEAAEYGVQVSVACPGPVKSSFHASLVRAGEAEAGRAAPRELLDATSAAQEILTGMERNEALIVFPRRARQTWWKWRISPSWLAGAQRVIVRNLRRNDR
jgi:NAD(P)-dependent dehydrogenase (short-subunit alcohol dehydrogenase family)